MLRREIGILSTSRSGQLIWQCMKKLYANKEMAIGKHYGKIGRNWNEKSKWKNWALQGALFESPSRSYHDWKGQSLCIQYFQQHKFLFFYSDWSIIRESWHIISSFLYGVCENNSLHSISVLYPTLIPKSSEYFHSV